MSFDDIEEYKYVIGQDPGETTGVAALRYTDSTVPELIYLTQIPNGHEGYLDWFEGSIVSDDLDYVSECWVEHNVRGANREPIRIEGVQYALWRDDITYQEPKMKQLISDNFLKDQNCWTPGMPHQMDGLRHALIFLRNNNHQPTLELLAGMRPDETIAQPGEAGEKSIDGGEGGEAAAEALEAMQEMGAQLSPLQEAMQELMRGALSDEEPNGSGEGDGKDPGYGVDTSTPEGDRKRREIGGTFAGWEPEEDEAVSLFDEKL